MPRVPERLVGVDVPEPGDRPLVEERRLHRRPPAGEPRAEVARREARPSGSGPSRAARYALELPRLEQLARCRSGGRRGRRRPIRRLAEQRRAGADRRPASRPAVPEAPRHPEVDQRARDRSRTEQSDTCRAARPRRRARRRARPRPAGLVRAVEPRVVDLDVRDPRARRARARAGANGLDLGQLGHASSLAERRSSSDRSRGAAARRRARTRRARPRPRPQPAAASSRACTSASALARRRPRRRASRGRRRRPRGRSRPSFVAPPGAEVERRDARPRSRRAAATTPSRGARDLADDRRRRQRARGRDRRPARGSSARTRRAPSRRRPPPRRAGGPRRRRCRGRRARAGARTASSTSSVKSGGPSPRTVVDRLADLERVADRAPERLVHVGEQADDLAAGAPPELEHRLGERRARRRASS